jgi:hypothetical protein
MNIFFVYLSAKRAARSLCDKHVIKLSLETAQLLSTAMHIMSNIEESGSKPNQALEGSDSEFNENIKFIYKMTHKNHPCAIWVRHSQENFKWTIEHGLELCYEYTRRFNKIHKSQAVIEYIQKHFDINLIKIKQFTMPAICMPEQYKISQDPTICYREYYLKNKSKFAKWKNTNPPDWWKI